MTTFTAKRVRPGLWVSTLLCGAFLLLLGTRYKEARDERRAFEESASATAPARREPPRSAPLVRGEITRWQPRVTLTGTLLPNQESSLSFKIIGRLASVRVKTGDRVEAGQKLAELDRAEARAQLDAALAQVQSAELQRTFAEENEQRTRALYEQGALSETQLIADRQRVDLARAQLEAARAQADIARISLANTQLIAPFAGHVTESPSAPGAIVTPGMVLFRLEDTSTLRLQATLPLADAAFAAPGTRVEIDDDTSWGERASSSLRLGEVTAVLPSVDRQTRRLQVVAEIANKVPAPLLANVFVHATLVSRAPVEVLKLPPSVLRPGSQDEVAIADAGRVRIARIEYARGDDGSLLVRAGISAGDQLLAEPGAQVKDGDPTPAVVQ